MQSLLECTSPMVTPRADSTRITKEELIQRIQHVCTILRELEEYYSMEPSGLTDKPSSRNNETICLVCGGRITASLNKHLKMAHKMPMGHYRRFYVEKQPLQKML